MKAGRYPAIVRCPLSNNVTGLCAYEWSVFLADEADWLGDYTAYDTWRRIADQLKPKPGIPIASSVYYKALEDAIQSRTRVKNSPETHSKPL